jgi:uncharacterized protein (TIGR02285 family)
MKVQFLNFIVLLFLFPCIAQGATNTDERTITWMHADFPPLHIISGEYKGQGPSDMIHDLMKKELPEYTHLIVTANLARTLEELKNGQQVLSVGLIPNPERNLIAHFSLPCVIVPPIGLVVRKNDIGKWPSPLNIGTFVQNNRLGISRSRSYSPSVDAALQQARPKENIFIDSSDKLFGNLLKMLEIQRIDGVLGYPFEAMYNARTAQIADRIAVIPIMESTQYIIGRIAAPRTAWGKQIISRINEILVKERTNAAYRQAFERWLTPDSIADFNRVYSTEFLQQP